MSTCTLSNAPKAPEVPAFEHFGGLIVLRCPYCGREHIHGAGYGHRAAHCGAHGGYVLVPPSRAGGDEWLVIQVITGTDGR